MIGAGNLIVLSDGQRTAFVNRRGNGIIVYYSEACYPIELSLHQESPAISVATLDCGYQQMYAFGPIDTKVDVRFQISGKIEIGGEELLKVFRTVDSLSIEGLFAIIQERIKERN